MLDRVKLSIILVYFYMDIYEGQIYWIIKKYLFSDMQQCLIIFSDMQQYLIFSMSLNGFTWVWYFMHSYDIFYIFSCYFLPRHSWPHHSSGGRVDPSGVSSWRVPCPWGRMAAIRCPIVLWWHACHLCQWRNGVDRGAEEERCWGLWM